MKILFLGFLVILFLGFLVIVITSNILQFSWMHGHARMHAWLY